MDTTHGQCSCSKEGILLMATSQQEIALGANMYFEAPIKGGVGSYEVHSHRNVL